MTAFLIRMLAESSLRSVLAAALVAAILAALRVRTARLRHTAWTVMLCAMMLMPVLPYGVPAIGVPFPFAEHPPDDGLGKNPHPGIDRDRRPNASAGLAVRPEFEQRAITPTAAPAEHRQSRAAPWPVFILWVYGTGVLVLSMRCWLGWRKAARIAYEARRVDVGAEPRLLARVSASLRRLSHRSLSARSRRLFCCL